MIKNLKDTKICKRMNKVKHHPEKECDIEPDADINQKKKEKTKKVSMVKILKVYW